jgi:hypothetical protein
MTPNNNTTDFEQSNREIDIFMTGRVLFDDGKQLGHLRGSGPKYYNYYDTIQVKSLRYHKSWGALMPVVEKIRSLGFRVDIHFSPAISDRISGCEIASMRYDDTEHAHPYNWQDDVLLATYTAILQFINYIKRKEENGK